MVPGRRVVARIPIWASNTSWKGERGAVVRAASPEGSSTGDLSPAWSPDGRSIAFLRLNTVLKGSLVVVPSVGASERVLRPISLREDVYRAMRPLLTWAADGSAIVYTTMDEETDRALGARPADSAATSTTHLSRAQELEHRLVAIPSASRLTPQILKGGGHWTGAVWLRTP
jgi:hypothetical protein